MDTVNSPVSPPASPSASSPEYPSNECALTPPTLTIESPEASQPARLENEDEDNQEVVGHFNTGVGSPAAHLSTSSASSIWDSRSRASSYTTVDHRLSGDLYEYTRSPERITDLDESESQLATTGQGHHYCLWKACTQPPYRSQNALIWHVKERHLMACPYLYCGRAPFTTNRGLVRHMLEHETMSPRSLPKILPKISTARQTSQAQHIAQLGSDIRIARMQLYFLEAESCDLLNEVLEARMNDVEDFKRHCRLRLAEETAKIKEDIVPFPVLWESSLLPFLCKFVTEWCGRGHSIGFVRGRSKDNKETLPPPRQICIMTRGRVALARTLVIVHHIQDLLPEHYKSSIKVSFSEGKIVRLRWARGLDEARPDGICDPRNPHHFDEPCMGDSIGVGKTLGYEEETATLGPRIEKGDESYWLASYHPFVEVPKVAGPDIEHPSPADRRTCRSLHPDLVELTGDADNGARFSLGKLVKASGIDLKTTRITRDPFWTEKEEAPPEIVMDWCLISSTGSGANYLRATSTGDGPQIRRRPVVSVAHIKPGAVVVASGRTSGLQRGRIGEWPMHIDHGDGTAPTKEWFIEQVDQDEDDNEWIMGGIGVQGDSGAAIVDAETSVLYGQLWGRNKNHGPGPRLAYFTPIHDILDDIVEKCEWDGAYPALPQVHGGPEGRVVENPTCCDPAPSPARVAATIPSTSALATSGGMRSREPSPPLVGDILPLGPIGVDPTVFAFMGPGPGPMRPPLVVPQKAQVEMDVKKRRVSFGSDKIEDHAKRIKV